MRPSERPPLEKWEEVDAAIAQFNMYVNLSVVLVGDILHPHDTGRFMNPKLHKVPAATFRSQEPTSQNFVKHQQQRQLISDMDAADRSR